MCDATPTLNVIDMCDATPTLDDVYDVIDMCAVTRHLQL